MYPAPPVPLPADGSFDPTWLVESVRAYAPSDAALIASATACTRYLSGTDLHVYFVSPARAHEPGAEWQFDRNEVIEGTKYGEIVLDILQDGRIGAIEFLDRVFLADREGRL